MIKVRPRADMERGAFAGRAAVAAAAAKAAAPQAQTRPGHNTPLLVLFGSNIGTAEELARAIADLGEVNGFATTLARSTIMPASCRTRAPWRSSAPPTMAGRRTTPRSSSSGCARRRRMRCKVRYTVFGCGNRDWASTYQAIPRQIDELLAAKGARAIYARGEGDARSDLDGHFQAWFAAARARGDKEFGVDSNLTPQRRRRAALPDRAGRAAGRQRHRRAGGVSPMRVLVNPELQNSRRQRVRPQHAAYRGATAGRHQLPRRRSSQHRAAQRSGAGRVRRAPLRLPAGRPDPAAAAEGRRAQLPVGEAISVDRLLTDFVELQQPATRKQIQTMAQHTRCPVTKPKLLAYVGDDAASTERYRAEILAKRKSVLDLLEEHPACELPFHAFLEMLPLMTPRYYSISSSPIDPARCSVTVGVVEGPARSGRGVYKGVCSNHLAGRRAGDTVQAMVRETKVGFRLPVDPAAPIIMIGPGTGLAPFRGFLRERAALRRKGASSDRRCCSSAAAIPSRISSMPTS